LLKVALNTKIQKSKKKKYYQKYLWIHKQNESNLLQIRTTIKIEWNEVWKGNYIILCLFLKKNGLDFGTVPTVWSFFVFILFMHANFPVIYTNHMRIYFSKNKKVGYTDLHAQIVICMIQECLLFLHTRANGKA
jgi:hypothetical protein